MPFPDAIDPSNLINTGSTTDTSGEGTIDRSETIDLRVAAIVTQVLPNGNLVLQGRATRFGSTTSSARSRSQGIIRPQDIST